MFAAGLLLFLACAQKPAAVASTAPASVAEAIAPRPFDADQLRAGIPQGTIIRLTIAQAGKPTAGDDGVMLVKRCDFAKTLPGPPALFTIERQGEEIFRMTMIERS